MLSGCNRTSRERPPWSRSSWPRTGTQPARRRSPRARSARSTATGTRRWCRQGSRRPARRSSCRAGRLRRRCPSAWPARVKASAALIELLRLLDAELSAPCGPAGAWLAVGEGCLLARLPSHHLGGLGQACDGDAASRGAACGACSVRLRRLRGSAVAARRLALPEVVVVVPADVAGGAAGVGIRGVQADRGPAAAHAKGRDLGGGRGGEEMGDGEGGLLMNLIGEVLWRRPAASGGPPGGCARRRLGRESRRVEMAQRSAHS
jgi:hypothetical protein